MNIETENIIPITKLQRELTQRIRSVAAGNSPLFVFKNNEMEAVILSKNEYEYLLNLSDIVEYFEIGDMLQTRLKKYDRKKNVKWEDIK
jgi:prevent-host-death family protein